VSTCIERLCRIATIPHPTFSEDVPAIDPSQSACCRRANGFNEEQKKENFKQTQHAIETLIESNLVKGTRLRTGGPGGSVYFAHLELTTSGEAEAIRQKHKVKEVVIDPAHRPRRQPIS
jgi:hypothetical protein